MVQNVLIIVAFGLCLVAPTLAEAGIDLSPEELRRLVQGELVVRPLPGSGMNSTVAGVSFSLINAPVERVMHAVTDISAWPHIFPNTYESKTVGERNGVRAVKMELGNRLIRMGFYLTLVLADEQNTVRFHLNKDKPHDIPDTRGWIRLIPQPGERTLVVFTGLAEIPFGALVALLGEDAIRWIEHLMLSIPARLKKWVEGPSGEKYRKAEAARATALPSGSRALPTK